MDEVIEISGLENACRLCLTTEQTRSSIFGVPHVSVPFVDKIRACLSIQVSVNDKLSTLVCTTCIKNVNHWHTYKDTCLQSQEKLQQWLAKQNNTIHPLVTVKEEPVDEECTADNRQITTNDSNASNHAISKTNNADNENITESNANLVLNKVAQALSDQSPRINDKIDTDNSMIQIKSEPMDTEDEDDCNVDVESVNSGELLINPMAVVANTVSNDRIMEADSTQKFGTRRFGPKKKMRRGPHTHYRGLRLFKKKCIHCKIYLHSKYSYMQHMSRYHGIVNNLATDDFTKSPSISPVVKQKSKLSQLENTNSTADLQNEFNPEDAEFVKMIKTDPLTPLQKNIISQLKTFSCYTCKQIFFDRRNTLNHIRQHMPDLRPFTCIACFTEFSNRSMYKLHCNASFECAMKIALVVPKVGNEKYFTCNMCLRSFNNRKELLTHLAMHADSQYNQLDQPLGTSLIHKPINMSPPTSSSPRKSISNFSGPYMNGDPAHNHMCDLCGMIYRYKPNMFKHRELCSTLPENIRTSYRCVHCSMTYLVYKKFYTHVQHDHKKREITCFTCHEKFPTPDDYLNHHETHRVLSDKDKTNDKSKQLDKNYPPGIDPLNSSNHPVDVNEKPFNCALCGEDFATKTELTEHRNLHLKVKIYSCVICRSMFSSSGALESHMKDHGIEDPGEQNANSSCVEYDRDSQSQNSSMNESSLSATSDPGGRFNHCYECGKNFSNLANLKRHERNLHIKQKRRWSCDECKRRFKSAEAYNEHVSTVHGLQQPQEQQQVEKTLAQQQLVSTGGKPLMQCPKCPRTFAYQGNLILHCQNVHKENHFERAKATAARQSAPPAPSVPPITSTPRQFTQRGHACDLCGKVFREKQSLKTHRGWHLRSSYRLKVDKAANLNESVMSGPGYAITIAGSSKPAKARKSFPNNPLQKQLDAIASLQCQVCDDRFTDVAELRKHLWDIHCARNKPEKNFAGELQCELCTTKFPDEESLDNHMKWHSQNPILGGNASNNSGINDEADNANVSSVASIISNSNVNKARVVRMGKVKKQFYCDVCGKYYSNRKMMLRHKKLHKVLPASTMMNFQSLQTKRHFCHSCQKNFSTDASLKRHKASSCHINAVRSQVQPKKITTTALVHQPPLESVMLQTIKKEPGVDQAATGQTVARKKPVTCLICKMIFPNMSVLYQHKQLVHKVPVGARVKSGAQQQAKCVPLMSAGGSVSCHLCGKQFPGVPNLKMHFTHKHKAKSTTSYSCSTSGCKLVFSSADALKNHEQTHSTIMFNCHLCDRHVFSRAAMTKHMLTMHKAIFQSGANKNNLWSETDLSTYSVKNCQSTVCPKCKIKYPNMRALKIHYLKFHENA